MSLVKRADVKNHLSARHRTDIHLTQPASQPDATGFAEEESAGADPTMKDSVENPLNIPIPGGPEKATIATSKSARS